MNYCLRLSATCVALSVLAFAPAHAEIFKWKDANGVTQYTQTPPPDPSKAKDIEQEISLSAGKGQAAPAKDTTSEENTDDGLEQARADGAKNELKHQTFCEQQQAALKQLLANPVIRWKSADGTDKVLSTKERTDKITDFEKNVKELCNKEVLAEKPSAS